MVKLISEVKKLTLAKNVILDASATAVAFFSKDKNAKWIRVTCSTAMFDLVNERKSKGNGFWF